MWHYAESVKHIDTLGIGESRTAYIQYRYNTIKRNALLLMVPRLFDIAHGRREYAGEVIIKAKKRDNRTFDLVKQLDVSTVPHHTDVLPSIQTYLKPDIYNEKVFIDRIMSPFNYDNRVFYKYSTEELVDGVVEVTFKPITMNTQLVKGRCIVDHETGKIAWFEFFGEFDMIGFRVKGIMDEGHNSIYVKDIDVETRMSLLGNKLQSYLHADFNIPELLPDSVTDCTSFKVAEEVRPTPLPEENQRIYDAFNLAEEKEEEKEEEESEKKVKFTNSLKKIGESLIFQTNGSFSSNRGNLSISPIINPLSFGYSSQRGVYYRMSMNINYDFSEKKALSLNVNGGYSFKQKLIYYSIPLRFTYNNLRNGYVEFVVGNGNRITNSEILKKIKDETAERIKWDQMDLQYFKDFRLDLNTNYDLSEYWSIQPGITYHRRSAVNKSGFILAGKPYVYYSTAPRFAVKWRPMGYNGMYISIDHEISKKDFLGSDFSYDRTEIDAMWKYNMKRMKCLSLRGGMGFYAKREDDTYFLDYTNFAQNNIPGGWNDNWTGDFKLLDANWYNASNYYVRGNITYESPLLLVSRLPFVGRFIEMERIYLNILSVEKITPYNEWGYGFKNRLFSAGAFVAFRNYKYHGVGVRFELELFNRW